MPTISDDEIKQLAAERGMTVAEYFADDLDRQVAEAEKEKFAIRDQELISELAEAEEAERVAELSPTEVVEEKIIELQREREAYNIRTQAEQQRKALLQRKAELSAASVKAKAEHERQDILRSEAVVERDRIEIMFGNNQATQEDRERAEILWREINNRAAQSLSDYQQVENELRAMPEVN